MLILDEFFNNINVNLIITLLMLLFAPAAEQNRCSNDEKCHWDATVGTKT